MEAFGVFGKVIAAICLILAPGLPGLANVAVSLPEIEFPVVGDAPAQVPDTAALVLASCKAGQFADLVARDSIEKLQRLPAELGHGPGPVDGLFGRQTRAAVADFQKSRGRAADGCIVPGLIRDAEWELKLQKMRSVASAGARRAAVRDMAEASRHIPTALQDGQRPERRSVTGNSPRFPSATAQHVKQLDQVFDGFATVAGGLSRLVQQFSEQDVSERQL